MRTIKCILLILATSFYCVAGNFRETPKKFHIRSITGKVLVWQPWDATWSTLKVDDRVWENTLIQVGLESSLSFSLETSEGFSGIKADSVEITINDPMIIRLGETLPRRTNLEDYFIPKLPDVLKGSEDQKKPLFEKMGEAWNRFAANVLRQGLDMKSLKSLQTESVEDAAKVSIRAKKIELYNPAAGLLAITERFPYSFRISWEEVNEPDIEYGIRVWRSDQKRPDPIDYTSQSYYSVRFRNEGKYYVQINSKDDRYQSEVHDFDIVLPLSNRGVPPSREAVHLPLPLELPPPNFVYLANELPQSITFKWDRPNAARGAQLYEFRLMDERNNLLFNRTLNQEAITVKMSTAGTFRWSVTASPERIVEGSQGPTISSEFRTITIEKEGDQKRKTAGSRLEKLIFSDSSRVFYLEGGF